MDTQTEQLAQKLQLWRSSHRAPARIPAEIWDEAAELARQHGVGPVARALKLDYACLKKRVGAAGVLAPTTTTTTTFVEFLPAFDRLEQCTVELQSARGTQVRVKLETMSAASLVTVLRGLVD